MARVVLSYPDGLRNLGWFNDGEQPCFVVGAEEYSIESLKNSGAVVVVNNEEILKRLHELGMPARPTPRQYKFTVSVSANTHERLRAACEKTGRTASRIIEELVIKWLDENGM